MSVKILVGDALAVLRTLPADTYRCAVTSPPYFGLRDYKVAGQMGRNTTLIELNPTYAAMARRRIGLFAEVA